MRIEVKQEDILFGRRLSHTHCPVALALHRVSGKACKVTASRIEREDGGRVETPWEVHEFVLRFDREEDVTPFGFDMPDEFLEAAHASE